MVYGLAIIIYFYTNTAQDDGSVLTSGINSKSG